MKCYSYFEKINHLADPIIELWRESWIKYGWEPVLLGAGDFLSWNDHDTYDLVVNKLPTVNNFIYERACFRRWGVMAKIGGGLMLDYDVMNYGFRPEDMPYEPGKCLILDPNAPCVVVGDQEAFLAACKTFMEYRVKKTDRINNRPHVSDMTIANSFRVRKGEEPVLNCFYRPDVVPCCEYNDPGWEDKPLIHFSNYSVSNHGRGKTRPDLIKSINR